MYLDLEHDSVINKILEGKETEWINPYYIPGFTCSENIPCGAVTEAEQRLVRFAPFIAKKFPETASYGGLIESPLTEIPSMKSALISMYNVNINGRMFLKLDSHLAVAGSIKARGGVYEVLKYAETLAVMSGNLSENSDYSELASDKWRDFFSSYTIQVGSTGNLGISIGIISAALGFRVKVHMSSDAKQWKKALLRTHGVEVIEYDSDYSHAVAEGRKTSASDPTSYFIDDERSLDLFLGYATAGSRLKKQLDELCIPVDSANPLIVYIPAGVGGAPGGITYGLKRLFGENVHCFFCEPTLYPSVTLGIATGRHEKVNVYDYGLGGMTEADGLACPSPSGLVTRLMQPLLSGSFTVKDGRLYDFLRLLHTSEGLEIEPSGCAAFAGVCRFSSLDGYTAAQGLTPEIMRKATHIAWATGGSMIPEDIKKSYLCKGISD